MAFKFTIPRHRTPIALPSVHRREETPEEPLTGKVQDMDASAPEERMAKALDRAGINYRFRYTVGAPRGLPGWKEVDFLVENNGLVYAAEVDTAFTHRDKLYADVLHDAIVLNDKNIQELGTIFPSVLHVDGDSDLANSANAKAYVQRQFGKG
jgi:hypothetical protein